MIAATITANEAAAIRWQAIVVGAGPAGTATAWRLADAGIRVLLVDRRPFPVARFAAAVFQVGRSRNFERSGPGLRWTLPRRSERCISPTVAGA